MSMLSSFSAILDKGEMFSDLLFPLLHTKESTPKGTTLLPLSLL